MSIIKDYKAIYEYRNRRQERVDGRRLDEEWNRGKPVEEEFPIRKRVTVRVKEPYDFREIDWLLDSIIQEAEMIKLFAEKNDGIGEDITERCVDIIQKNVRYLTFHMREANVDSAFFAGELDDGLGEKNIQYPEVGPLESEKMRADDDDWVTIKGTHVLIDDNGVAQSGGKIKGKQFLDAKSSKTTTEGKREQPKSDGLKVGKTMAPINSDYDYEEGDDSDDFTHKNIEKLMPIYKKCGIEACDDEWFKFRLSHSTQDVHKISKDEADEIMYDNVRQSIYDGWFRAADSSYKPQLTDAVVKNPATRNAALNLAYENYRNSTDNPLPFEKFLATPIKMYRGEKGQKHVADDIFDAYTFDSKMARHFAGQNGTVTEVEIRPIDTYGSMRAVGEAEIWVPRQLSPVGYKRPEKKRREDANDDIQWITVNGAHIPIDDDGSLGGKVGDKIEENVKKAKSHFTESKAPSMEDDMKKQGYEKNEEGRWVHSENKEPVTRRRVNQKLNEIADSDKSEEEKVEAIASELNSLRNGTKLVMPDSWDDDDGKKQIYTYNKDLGVWEDNHGWGSMDSTEMSYYFLDKDPAERPKIQSVPRDPESVEASRKRREESKNYAMNPDGSIDGKYTLDFHNDHVSQEERDRFRDEIKEMVDYEKGWDDSRSLYRNEANRVGERVADEIKRRAALRKGDKENCPINDQPQVEDIYDVLKDMREFGPPEGFEPRISSDLPQERTDAIVKEALDRFPMDWFRDAKSAPVINIIDGPGRAICLNDGYINVYTKKDLKLSSGEMMTLNDRALVNDLAHELGHYMEWNNQKVQYSARDCLWERGKDTDIIEVEPGYSGYKDSFFNPYMGKIYSHGGTEIISMVMENIGCFQPFSVLEGHEYDYTKGKYDGRKKRDKESLRYVLGVLAGL